MLAVVFLAVWLGLAAALPDRARWWGVGPLVVVIGLAVSGQIAAIWYAALLTPIGAVALSLVAGWTESRRANLAMLAVVALVLAGYPFLGWGDWRGRPDADEILRFTGIVLAVGAVPWCLARAAHDLSRWLDRRVPREPRDPDWPLGPPLR